MAVMPAQKPGRSKQDYTTPKPFLKAVKSFLGIYSFSHDFAADKTNAVSATYYDEEMDALSMSRRAWAAAVSGGDRWGWLNPPYSDIAPWAERCCQLKADGGSVALLVPAGIGSNWFRDFVDGQALVLALNGRLTFPPETSPYPKDLILCLYSDSYEPGFMVWNWRE